MGKWMALLLPLRIVDFNKETLLELMMEFLIRTIYLKRTSPRVFICSGSRHSRCIQAVVE